MSLADGTVLLVEDAEVHVEFTRLAFVEQGVPGQLVVARDGEDGLAAAAAHAGDPLRLVLLDLNLPDMSGFDVLQALRAHADPRVRRVPVVVLTTSRAPEDIRRAYDLTASSFVAKPGDLDDFLALVGEVRAWWLERVELAG